MATFILKGIRLLGSVEEVRITLLGGLFEGVLLNRE